MGDGDFVSEIQDKIEKVLDDLGIPKKQKRAVSKSLSEIEQQAIDRDSAIITAYAMEAYSQREIGEYIHLYPSAVGVFVRWSINS